MNKRSLVKDLLFSVFAFNLPLIILFFIGTMLPIVSGYIEHKRTGVIEEETYIDYVIEEVVPGRFISFEQYSGEIIKSALDIFPKLSLLITAISIPFGYWYHRYKVNIKSF